MTARIVRVGGALVQAGPFRGAALFELVRVGEAGLLGEVIRIDGELATIQVYEDTTGLGLGDPVVGTGSPLVAELGPGLLGAVLDGVGRPLARLAAAQGDFLLPGATAPTLDPARRLPFVATARVGDRRAAGDVLGEVVVGAWTERVLVPPGRGGVLAALDSGTYGPWDPIGRLDDGPLTLAHRWPVRAPRPVAARLPGTQPLITGQRVIDLLFPVAQGGTVAVPGGFGTGKTVIEQSLARHADADIVVYVGCGERGNEMADLLAELPHLADPRTGRTLSERTVLVVNTSNMPVAAREASIYLGFTIAEYFRDQGLKVALLADSLSRWAEALREIGSRLQEMPGEEGYPTSLGNRLGAIYERAGRVTCVGAPERTGAVTFVSAISPPGGDFSEPVTQASLRVAGGLWALDARLAHQRQFPAIAWEQSYTAYADRTAAWFEANGGPGWAELRARVLALLQHERELRDVAELVGEDALEDADRVVLRVARVVREVVTGQSAYHPHDAMSDPPKTWALARLATALLDRALEAVKAGRPPSEDALGAARRALVGLRDGAPAERADRVAACEAAVDAVGGAR